MPSCCDWEQFEYEFLHYWKKQGIGELLIDWKRARRDFKLYCCTGPESAKMQILDMSKDTEYLWAEKINKYKGNDDGGVAKSRKPVTA